MDYKLLIIMLFSGVYSREPECSSFHFVEKTLERVISTESRVEQMKSDVERKQENMAKSLDEMRTRLEQTESDAGKVKSEEWGFVGEINNATKELQPVAFQARDIMNKGPVSGETLIFTNTEFDQGSGYDNLTGVYHVPESGVYMFNLQLCLYSNRYIYFAIVTEKATIITSCFERSSSSSSYRRYSSILSNEACQSISGIAVLTAHESVWVKAGSSTSGTDFYEDSNTWNSFSGVLINRTS